MIGRIVVLTCLVASALSWAANDKRAPYPSYQYGVARAHEVKPHRRIIQLEGVSPGFNQLRLTLAVSPTGEVIDANASGNGDMKFWPKVKSEVRQWKFTPFERDGRAVTAEVQEYVDLVPPERLPKNHAAAPPLRPDSKVTITLERTGCYGSCPSYTVTVSTDGIVFDGREFVVARGKHKNSANADEVRKLAKSFIAADFYSMDSSYIASVTDNPTDILSISIDGRTKRVVDYVGSSVGMPEVVTQLENEVDAFARTQQWIGVKRHSSGK